MKFIAVVEDKKNITAMANRLKKLGCTSIKLLPVTGVITGDTGKNSIKDIAIKGFRSVEEDRTISL